MPMRSGNFKKGHEKLGGRERGTPNFLSADYKKLLLEAAHRIGHDGNGKDGVIGYFRWVAQYHPRAFVIQGLSRILDLEHYLGEMTNEPCRTAEELDRKIRNYIGVSNTTPNAGPTNAARDDLIANMVPESRIRRGKSSRQDWNWTGRNDEI